jgi:hypothetical protein
MDRFIALENIKHFRDRLRSEPDPAARSMLQRLLVEEEDKLAADLELLADVAQEIVRCQEHIDRQRVLVKTLERDGLDGATARALLNGLIETLAVHRDYRQRIATRVEQNR